MSGRYDGPIEVGMVFTAPDNEGKLGLRRVKVIAETELGTLVLEELPARQRYAPAGAVYKCPESNLRIVFQLEEVAL